MPTEPRLLHPSAGIAEENVVGFTPKKLEELYKFDEIGRAKSIADKAIAVCFFTT